jgi:hypothetical protein
MPLFLTTLLVGLLLLAVAVPLLWNGNAVGPVIQSFPRSRRAAYVTVGFAAAWTLYRITQLGQADFGNYKIPLLIAFTALAVLSFRYVPDFLSVRGTAALILLVADVLLTSAYMKYDLPQRLLLVGIVYFSILLALYLAVCPYRARDFFDWLFSTSSRPRTFGLILGTYGLVLTVVSLTY